MIDQAIMSRHAIVSNHATMTAHWLTIENAFHHGTNGRKNMKTTTRILVRAAAFAVLALGALPNAGHAQGMRLERAVIAPAGGTSSNPKMIFTGTVAQPMTGVATNGKIAMQYGFWTAAKPSSSVGSPTQPNPLDVQLWPNPSSNQTSLKINLDQRGIVEIGLYDESGHFVRSLDRSEHAAGPFTLQVDTAPLASGTYLIAIRLPNGVAQQRMSVVH